MQQAPKKILQKLHNPPFQAHYHLHFCDLFHPEKIGKNYYKKKKKDIPRDISNKMKVEFCQIYQTIHIFLSSKKCFLLQHRYSF